MLLNLFGPVGSCNQINLNRPLDDHENLPRGAGEMPGVYPRYRFSHKEARVYLLRPPLGSYFGNDSTIKSNPSHKLQL